MGMESEITTPKIGHLVRRAQAGDMESYDEIVRRFRASAFGHTFARLGDSQLAEDAVQEAFVQAHLNLGPLTVPEAFPAWFRKVVATACNRITRKKVVATVPLSDAENIAVECAGPAADLEQMVRDRLMHAAIQSLSDGQRTITALYYIGGMTQREVADYLGLSETAVKKRLHDARRKLGKYVIDKAKTISDQATPTNAVSARVIAELVGWAQLVLIEGHPVRMIVDRIKAVLPEYDLIETREVEEADIYPSIGEAYASGNADAYRLDELFNAR